MWAAWQAIDPQWAIFQVWQIVYVCVPAMIPTTWAASGVQHAGGCGCFGTRHRTVRGAAPPPASRAIFFFSRRWSPPRLTQLFVARACFGAAAGRLRSALSGGGLRFDPWPMPSCFPKPQGRPCNFFSFPMAGYGCSRTLYAAIELYLGGYRDCSRGRTFLPTWGGHGGPAPLVITAMAAEPAPITDERRPFSRGAPPEAARLRPHENGQRD